MSGRQAITAPAYRVIDRTYSDVGPAISYAINRVTHGGADVVAVYLDADRTAPPVAVVERDDRAVTISTTRTSVIPPVLDVEHQEHDDPPPPPPVEEEPQP